MNDHLSSLTVADKIKRLSTCERITRYAGLLAADRVYLLRMLPCVAVVSYTMRLTRGRCRGRYNSSHARHGTRFTLTCHTEHGIYQATDHIEQKFIM